MRKADRGRAPFHLSSTTFTTSATWLPRSRLAVTLTTQPGFGSARVSGCCQPSVKAGHVDAVSAGVSWSSALDVGQFVDGKDRGSLGLAMGADEDYIGGVSTEKLCRKNHFCP